MAYSAFHAFTGRAVLPIITKARVGTQACYPCGASPSAPPSCAVWTVLAAGGVLPLRTLYGGCGGVPGAVRMIGVWAAAWAVGALVAVGLFRVRQMVSDTCGGMETTLTFTWEHSRE